MSILLRLFLIPVGYIAAILVAASTAAIIEWLRAYGPVADDPAALGMTSFVVLTDWFVLMVVLGYAVAIPSLVAVAAAEIFSIRSALYFAMAGLVIAFVAGRITDLNTLPPFIFEPVIAAASGIAGGFAYWVSSGQWSGMFKAKELPPQ